MEEKEIKNTELEEMVKELYEEVVAPKKRKKELEEAAELAIKIQDCCEDALEVDLRDVDRYNELVHKLFHNSDKEDNGE